MTLRRPTHALQNIPWVGWLESFPAGPWLALTILWILLLGVTVSTRGSESIEASIVMPCAMAGVIAAWLFLQRGAEVDLWALGFEARLDALGPAKVTARVEAACGVVYGIATAVALEMFFHPEFVVSLHGVGSLPVGHLNTFTVLVWLTCVAFGVCQIHLLTSVVRHMNAITALTWKVEVDLMRIEQLAIFANPALRYGLLSSINLAWIAFLDQIFVLPPEFAYGWLPFLLLLWVIFAARPLFAIRYRIRAAKIREIHLVREAIDGRWDDFATCRLAHLQDELGVADLLAYEDRIQSIWEWPIEKRVQRLVLYLVLPPTAWVLGALVERAIDTYMS